MSSKRLKADDEAWRENENVKGFEILKTAPDVFADIIFAEKWICKRAEVRKSMQK